MFIFDNGKLKIPRYIINFPTKRHWRDNSRIEDIQSGLRALIEDVRRLGIRSIAVPPLGCGLGGLNWHDVRPMIEKSFSELPDVRVLLFPPEGPPAPKLTMV
jgi:O-acetyl-ADP-ribose deacetylase (regulator of RNase III)